MNQEDAELLEKCLMDKAKRMAQYDTMVHRNGQSWADVAGGYAYRISAAQKSLASDDGLSDAEVLALIEAEKPIRHREKALKTLAELERKFQLLRGWEYPTPKHEALKVSACGEVLEAIHEIQICTRHSPPPDRAITVEEWRAERRASLVKVEMENRAKYDAALLEIQEEELWWKELTESFHPTTKIDG